MNGLCSCANVCKQTNRKRWPQCRKRSVWPVLHQARWFMCQWVLMRALWMPIFEPYAGSRAKGKGGKRQEERDLETGMHIHPAFLHTKTRPPASSTSHPACFISHTHTLLRLYTSS